LSAHQLLLFNVFKVAVYVCTFRTLCLEVSAVKLQRFAFKLNASVSTKAIHLFLPNLQT
jgi:hypothetical protein